MIASVSDPSVSVSAAVMWLPSAIAADIEAGKAAQETLASVDKGLTRTEKRDLQRLVRGLNQIGLKPSGIIAILQAIKTAGALQADVIVQ